MRLIRQFVLFAIVTAFAAGAYAQSGRDIMQKQKDMQSTENEYSVEQMLLVAEDGSKELRQVTRHTKEVGDGLHKGLVVFLAPADIDGTALLNWEHADREDDQWLYMPALGKLQRIAKGSKKNYFMGTDFTYEDMSSEELDNFKYTIINEEQEGGYDCWVIEAVPVESYKRETSYSKRNLWIAKDIYSTVKVDFYGRRGDKIKTQQSAEMKHLGGTVYRAMKTIMDNQERGTKTLIKNAKIDIDTDIDESMFTERTILSGQHKVLR